MVLWSFLGLLLQSFVVYRLCKVFVTFLRPFLLYVVYPRLGWLTDLEPYKNLWTVVTGCTDGIGKAYTEELARRGCKKFILISRSPEKLENFANKLKDDFGAESRIVPFDFQQRDYAIIKREIESVGEIGILVNNVGMAPEGIERFHQHPEGLAEKIVDVNIVSCVKMCELVLGKMTAQDKGIVVIISSVLGWRPFSFLSTYSASKGCISYLCEALQREYKGTKIKIQCLIPMYVATKMTKYEKATGFHIVTPQTFAKEAVQIIGARHIAMGCINHEILAGISQLVPFWITKYVYAAVIRMEKNRMAFLHQKKQ